jgi:hypothetical protein
MPSTVRENELHGSILAFAADGIYPESQDVVASEFPVSSLPEELQRISEVRTQVQVGREHPFLTSKNSHFSYLVERNILPKQEYRYRRRRMGITGPPVTCRH